MSVEFNCPKCDSIISFKFLKAGEKGVCSFCKAEVIVPAPGQKTALEVTENKEKNDLIKIRGAKLTGGSIFKLLLIGTFFLSDFL